MFRENRLRVPKWSTVRKTVGGTLESKVNDYKPVSRAEFVHNSVGTPKVAIRIGDRLRPIAVKHL